MELRKELLLSVGAIVLLNLFLAFGAIGLLVRMGPAIERIIEENVYSIVAAEDLLAVFASAGQGPVSEGGRDRARVAIEKARSNVTEKEEEPVLERIDASLEAAFAAQGEARVRLVEATRDLIVINRDAMREVDTEAQRLGSAGAWAAVFVGFLTLVLSLAVLARMRQRVVLPVLELHEVLAEGRTEGKRRCRPRQAPAELQRLSDDVNRLLDERMEWQARGRREDRIGSTRAEDGGLLGAAVLALLEHHEDPALVLDSEGKIVRANAGALETLSGPGGERLRDALRLTPPKPAVDESSQGADAGAPNGAGQTAPLPRPLAPWSAERLPNFGWICTLPSGQGEVRS
ncbi:MAG: hypothetical protein R3E97_22995 [Candidatus Eisenbacteria bacterium]